MVRYIFLCWKGLRNSWLMNDIEILGMFGPNVDMVSLVAVFPVYLVLLCTW
jgi:hypothetical protein